MQRILTERRTNWEEAVEARGLKWHTGTTPYWSEDAYYQFSTEEIDAIERATNELHARCLEAVQHVIDVGTAQGAQADSAIAAGQTNGQILDTLRANLLAQPDNVVPGSIQTTDTAIFWTSPDGLRSSVDLVALRQANNAGTDAAGDTTSPNTVGAAAVAAMKGPDFGSASALFASALGLDGNADSGSFGVAADGQDTTGSCKKAIVLAAYTWQFEPNDAAPDIAAMLRAKNWDVKDKYNDSLISNVITVEDFKAIRDAQAVVISTHGTRDPSLGVCLDTGERISPLVPNYFSTRKSDYQSGRLAISIGKFYNSWVITPAFVSRYMGLLDDAIIYVDACKSQGDLTMADAFLGRGASAYLGYTDTVRAEFSTPIGKSIFATLLDGKTVLDVPGMNSKTDSGLDNNGNPVAPATIVVWGDKTAKLHDSCENIKDLEVVARYSWNQGSNDLDTGTTFLDGTVGFSAPGGNDYLSFTSGDNTSNGGSETATVNVGQAFVDAKWNDSVTIACAAGWYEPANGSGPAELDVVLRNKTTLKEVASAHKTLSPGHQNGLATTSVGTITVTTVDDTSGTVGDKTATITLA
jgi:hypothetical protein